MHYHKIKPAKLIVLILFAAAALSYASSGGARAGAASQQPRGRVEIAGQGTPLAERFGNDDGASLIIHFSGMTHGSLDPCG